VRFGASFENYGLACQMPPGEQLHVAELFQSIRSKRYFAILAAIKAFEFGLFGLRPMEEMLKT
jgi:hypothetical protein